MTKKDYFGYLLLVCIGSAGIWINGFLGGIMSGFAFSILIFVSLGKWLAGRTVTTIDKIVNDITLNRKNLNDD